MSRKRRHLLTPGATSTYLMLTKEWPPRMFFLTMSAISWLSIMSMRTPVCLSMAVMARWGMEKKAHMSSSKTLKMVSRK